MVLGVNGSASNSVMNVEAPLLALRGRASGVEFPERGVTYHLNGTLAVIKLLEKFNSDRQPDAVS